MPHRSREQLEAHVLDFLCDDEGSCALTIFLHGARFHIIADANKLAPENEIGKEYHSLVTALRNSDSTEGSPNNPKHTESSPSDSGVDVSERQQSSEKEQGQEGEDVAGSEEQLQQWMMSPLLETMRERAAEVDSSPQTIQDWYHCPTSFYDLTPTSSGKRLGAFELEDTSDLRQRMEKLLPQATLPKYITDTVDVSFYQASELIVLDASDEPPGTPYHPCRVQHRKTKKTHFLKVVDNAQFQAVKREINILHQIEHSKLHWSFNVPSLNGLVTFDNVADTAARKRRIMGFLLTEITDPIPLTTMLRSEVPKKKRDAWAKEVRRVKDILHENDIVWGDAKADNFMVDSNGDLWIIDFGGSYTEGWVEPHLAETEEGDDAGAEKIVNALKDPEVNVDHASEGSSEVSTDHRQLRKRKRGIGENEDGGTPTEREPRAARKRVKASDN